MQQKEIEELIVAALRDLQTVSGREWIDLGPESRPLDDLDGFDSLSAVEVTAAIEQTLECKFENESIFVSDDGKRALNLKQITQLVEKAVAFASGNPSPPDWKKE
jgi:acyl carrier protein